MVKPLDQPEKLRLKKACNGHATRGDKEYYKDLALIAAKRTKRFLLTLPLKKLLER